MDYSTRQKELRRELTMRGLDALLVTHLPNVSYLCGFSGSTGVLIAGAKRSLFITDGRYTAQAREEVRDARVIIGKRAALNEAANQIARLKLLNVAVEADRLTVSAHAAVKKQLPEKARLRNTMGIVDRLRTVKDAEEIARIRAAVLLSANVFDSILGRLRPGVTESEIAGEMEFAMRRAGAQGASFPTIVAGGVRSALPHGRASDAALPQRGLVVLDHGAILSGYCSDQTRTVHLGKPDAQARRMYGVVRDAQQAAVAAVRAGRSVGEVDRAARSRIARAGFGRFFTHSTGHGVGLEIHEAPRIAARQTEKLAPGMVITIEPGIYVPGVGGVRIEDMVVVTEDGCEVLTPTTRELIAL
jgi:Xaa-Pro aminopeptidase